VGGCPFLSYDNLVTRNSRWLRVKDPFPGLSHWAGALLSVAGLVLLLSRAAGRPWWQVAGFAVYGGSLVLLYVASALAHSVHCSPEAAARLDRLDYAAIFLLIAGSYTPLCLVTLHGPWGWSLLAAVWATAAFGIAALYITPKNDRVRVLTYVSMGWLSLFAAGALVRALPTTAILWLIAGGVIYTVGAVVFLTNRPHLWPGRFAAHDLWHCMVLAASGCHFLVIHNFVAPA
jgi:hemolysin III